MAVAPWVQAVTGTVRVVPTAISQTDETTTLISTSPRRTVARCDPADHHVIGRCLRTSSPTIPAQVNRSD